MVMKLQHDDQWKLPILEITPFMYSSIIKTPHLHCFVIITLQYKLILKILYQTHHVVLVAIELKVIVKNVIDDQIVQIFVNVLYDMKQIQTAMDVYPNHLLLQYSIHWIHQPMFVYNVNQMMIVMREKPVETQCVFQTLQHLVIMIQNVIDDQ